MKGRIILFYLLRKIWPSGMTAFTAHLRQALVDNGYSVTVVRPVSKRWGAYRELPFGNYGFSMEEWNAEDSLYKAENDASIICTPQRREFLAQPDLVSKLYQRGSVMVIHDPSNFKDVGKKWRRSIVIRESMLAHLKGATFLPHPYVRQYLSAQDYHVKSKHAVCTARIATAKRPRLILQANRLLPKKLRVEMKGAENRMVSYGLMKTYGDVYKQSGRESQYPQSFMGPLDMLKKYRYHVDMTKFEGDGGGTQYAQLEAIDAGCVPIMHRDWDPDARLPWMLRVDGAEGLAHYLRVAADRSTGHYHRETDEILRRQGQKLLKEHDHKKVGKLWAEALGL